MTHLSSYDPEITTFGEHAGQRNAQISWPNGVRMLVYPTDRSPDATEIAREIADALARPADFAMRCDERVKSAREERDRAKAEVSAAMRRIPPPTPQRLSGPGCIREDALGNGLWVLNRPDAGWSEWGMRFDGWDDLFRHLDVRVGKPITDAHGIYWPAEPRKET